MDENRISRRKVAAAGAAALIVPRHVLGGPAGPAPSDKLNIAGVGVGAMGANYLQNCETENIVALADVDHDFAAKTFARYPKAAVYKDYRAMLEKEKGIDAVIIGTPDHTHGVVAMAALRLGKHVYCAKPMCRTVHEVREVTKAARERKLATQMSTQSAASENACATVEMLQSGIIGAVREIHMSTDRPIWPQGIPRPAETFTPPPKLDWDLWIGPAPMRPYTPFYHPFNWRGWYDFGTGALGDMALHSFHIFWGALRLTYPTKISASVALAAEGWRDPKDASGRLRTRKVRPAESFPHAEIITFEFPARGEMPPARLLWYDGGLLPPRPEGLEAGVAAPTQYYVGEKGVLIPGRGGFTVLANGKPKEFTPPPKTIPRTIGHYQEWIAAAKGGKPANCNFDYACLFAETSLLGVIAARTGRDLSYDAENMRFTNDVDANQLLKPTFRTGWSL